MMTAGLVADGSSREMVRGLAQRLQRDSGRVVHDDDSTDSTSSKHCKGDKICQTPTMVADCLNREIVQGLSQCYQIDSGRVVPVGASMDSTSLGHCEGDKIGQAPTMAWEEN